MEIMAMHRNGKSIRAIAKETGRHRNTVKKHLLGDDFPHYHKGAARESILAPHFQTVQDYLEEDGYKARELLHREITSGERPSLLVREKAPEKPKPGKYIPPQDHPWRRSNRIINREWAQGIF